MANQHSKTSNALILRLSNRVDFAIQEIQDIKRVPNELGTRQNATNSRLTEIDDTMRAFCGNLNEISSQVSYMNPSNIQERQEHASEPAPGLQESTYADKVKNGTQQPAPPAKGTPRKATEDPFKEVHKASNDIRRVVLLRDESVEPTCKE